MYFTYCYSFILYVVFEKWCNNNNNINNERTIILSEMPKVPHWHFTIRRVNKILTDAADFLCNNRLHTIIMNV